MTKVRPAEYNGHTKIIFSSRNKEGRLVSLGTLKYKGLLEFPHASTLVIHGSPLVPRGAYQILFSETIITERDNCRTRIEKIYLASTFKKPE